MNTSCLAITDRANGTVEYTTCVSPDDPNGDDPVAPALASTIFLRSLVSPVPGIFYEGIAQNKTEPF